MTSRRSMMLPAAAGAVLLTMMALVQAFQEQRWFMPSVFAVAVAFGTGWAARRLDVPGILAPALSVLAMLALLGILFVPETTAFGFPTAATMQAIGDQLGAAMTDISEMAPPARATDALTLLATAGVFVVAMLVDLLVFWLRRPVAAGMPLLALFLIPTAMAESSNVFAFVLAAVGYLGILVAEGRDRARAWGRRLSGVERADEFADVTHVARVGRRIGSAAVGVALCVPLALPSVGDGIFQGTGGGGLLGKGKGDQTAFVVNPIVEIRTQVRSDARRELFTVQTNSPQYLRLTTLDEFNGSEWTIVKRKTGSDHRVGGDGDETVPTPREFEGMATQTIDYDVAIGDQLIVNWLPLAYAPRVVDVKGDWRYEDENLSIFSAENKSQNVTYRAQSVVADPTVEQLRAPGELPRAIADVYLKLPQDVPAPQSAIDVLEKYTEGKETQYDKAVALNAYFYSSNLFTYSLDVAPGTNTDDLDEFLTRRTGYCEQFAAAMAYLARLAGIPSRVVVGFTPGAPRPDGRYSVSNKDAHAWPELYFPRTGWVRFEPTPRGGTEPPGYALPPPTPGQTTDQVPPTTPVPSAAPTAAPTDRPRQVPEDEGAAAGTPQAAPPAAADGGVPVAPLAGAAVLAGLGLPSLVGWATRRRRRARATDALARIHAAWASLADAAEDAGHPLRAADSPRGSARRLVAAAALDGTVAEEVARLAAAEERARYAPSAPPVDGLDAAAQLVRRTLLGNLPTRARIKALVFPASSLRRMGEFVRGTSDAVERWRTAGRTKAAALVRRRRPRAV